MRELSLHINDIVQNSIEASATLIEIFIKEDLERDLLSIEIKDNGYGIDTDKLKDITNPFTTSRKTRRIGLGLSLFEAAAKRCNGDFIVESKVGYGTVVKAIFQHSHVDRAPLGNMSDCIIAILLSLSDDCDLKYTHCMGEFGFVFDTHLIRELLGKKSIREVEVLNWVREYINEGLYKFGKKA